MISTLFSTIRYLLRLLFGFFIKGYIYMFLGSILIFSISLFCVYISSKRSKFNYYAKNFMLYFGITMGCSILSPLFLWRPKDVSNIMLTSYVLRNLAYFVGVTYELRGVNISSDPQGAFIVANHTNAFDMLAKINMTPYFTRFTAVSKKEMLYVLPFGIPAYLAGVVFINRKSKSSFNTLDKAAIEVIQKKKVKIIIYPEGTRNTTDQVLLPFKKGAFISAIKAQIPIMPCVFSRYYFLNDKKKIFDNGHVIISVLPKISTKGMTLDNLDQLIEKTRNLMLNERIKLDKEIDECKEKWAEEKHPRIIATERLIHNKYE